MGVIDILFIGIGLSMDAFAVSICKGLKMKVVDLKQCLMIAWFFGIFQAIMPTIGYVLSSKFVEYINAYSHWVAFVLLTIIGANMIRESVGNEEEETDGKQVVGIKELFGLAIATSIDALAVGITFGTREVKLHLFHLAVSYINRNYNFYYFNNRSFYWKYIWFQISKPKLK